MTRFTGKRRVIAVGLKIWANFSNRAMEGILGYARESSQFEFRDMIWTEAEQIPGLLARLRPDGLILSLTSVDYQNIRGELPANLPIVSIGADTIDPRVGVVCSDDRGMISLAVEHLRSAGYRRIGFVGWEGSAGTARRATLLRQMCRSAESFNVALQGPVEDLDAATKLGLKTWLTSLKKPAGIIAWSGGIAGHVLRVAHELGLSIPQDVGIVSLSDDRPCLVVEPAISAIDVAGQELGQRSMSMLAAIMNGQPPPGEPSMVTPAAVIPRGSTAAAGITNDPVAAALKFIEENALRGIVVKNVLAVIPRVGRTTFYTEFTDRMGCSPADYMRQIKIKRAKELLQTTELSITRIAAMCGFASATQFGDTFKREAGVTPTGFRNR